MLDLDDPMWATLAGGRRTVTDVRSWLRRLETDADSGPAWAALWDQLHHQGDVDLASYAAVPHLVRIHRQRGVVDWNAYALVATIELAREGSQNPALPAWADRDYEAALQDLAAIGLKQLPHAEGSESVRSILALAAIVRGERVHGRVLLDFDSHELQEIMSAYEAG